MSFGMIVWSLVCVAAGFALHAWVQNFAWYKKFADRVKTWAKGD